LINPANFPCRAHDLDTAAIETSATDLRTMGTTVHTETTAIDTTWSGLSAHYEAPEQDQVYTLIDPAVTDAGDLKEALHSAAGYLDTYASELAGLKSRLESCERDAWTFRNDVKDGVMVPESEAKDANLLDAAEGMFASIGIGNEEMVEVPWYEDGDSVDRNKELLEEYGGILADISTAVATCANDINGLIVNVCVAEVEAIPAEAFSNPEMPMPWGSAREEDRNCHESVGHGISDFGYGLYSGAASLIGYDTEAGEWGLDVAGNAWGGLGNFLGSTVVMVVGIIPNAVMLATGTDIPDNAFGDWYTERLEVAAGGWSSLVGYDLQAAMDGGDGWHKWKEDGWATGTESLLNVGTFFIPGAGQVGGALKTGSVGARLARITGVVSDFVVPGGSFVVKGGTHFLAGLRNAVRFGDDVPVGPGSSVRFNPAGLIDDVTDIPPVRDTTPVTNDIFGPQGDGVPRTPEIEGDNPPPRVNDPVEPTNPTHPNDPTHPTRPDDPTTPVKPEEPEGPVNPDEPEGPASPEEPEGPADPEMNSDEPDGSNPDESDGSNPDESGGSNPDESGGTAEPEPKPGTERTPGRPETRYDPETEAPETVSSGDKDAPSYTDKDVQDALDRAPVDEEGRPVDPRTGEPLKLTDINGNRGWEMRWDPESQQWVAQLHGNGYPSGMPDTGVPNSFGYDGNGQLMPYANNRPPYADGQVEAVFDTTHNSQVDDAAAGLLLDENGNALPAPGPDQIYIQQVDGSWDLITWRPGEPRQGLWDMGHTPDSKYSELRRRYLNHELSPDPLENLEIFLEEFQADDNYFAEGSARNQSHMDE
ncbi:GH-E family nuclease, partial [Pseudactinotalea sp.]|uniref:GH-E family nuclease n=1 Tax=Pseudactinotalea sp. TaxID=1926260 RepID=UPI003B3A17AC